MTLERAQEKKEQNTFVEPLIDSQTPPVGIDNVLLAESGTGSIRLIGFSGNAFVLKEEKISTPDGDAVRFWVRPTSVIDLSRVAVRSMEWYLLQHLLDHPKELKEVLESFPDIAGKVKAVLGTLEEAPQKENEDAGPTD